MKHLYIVLNKGYLLYLNKKITIKKHGIIVVSVNFNLSI